MNSVPNAQKIIQALMLAMCGLLAWSGVGDATVTPCRLGVSDATSSCSASSLSKVDIEKAVEELDASKAILSVLLATDSLSPSMERYVHQLEELCAWKDSVMEQLPQHANYLGGRLMGLRMELMDSVEKSGLWVRLSRATNPDKRHRLPARFIRQRAPVEVAFPVEELSIAAELRYDSMS